MNPKSFLKRLAAIARFIYTPLSLGLIVYLGWSSRAVLADTFQSTQPLGLLIPIALWLIANCFSPMATVYALRSLGGSLSYRSLLKIHLRRLPGKYLPGGIWQTVGRFADMRAMGVPPSQLAGLLIVELALAPLSAITIGGLLLVFVKSVGVPFPVIVACTAIAGLSVALFPWVFNRTKTMFKRGGKDIAAQDYLPIILWIAVFWILAAASFSVYLTALHPSIGMQSPLLAPAVYLVSWAIGNIAVFAPQGIGVFEVVAHQLSGWPLSIESGIALLAGFRVVALCGDILGWAASYLFFREV